MHLQEQLLSHLHRHYVRHGLALCPDCDLPLEVTITPLLATLDSHPLAVYRYRCDDCGFEGCLERAYTPNRYRFEV